MPSEATALMDADYLAAILDEAAKGAREVDQLTLTHSIDLPAAYEIQRRNVARRLDRGDTMTGVKMGFTSVAKMKQMGVDESIWGRLTAGMAVPNGGELVFSRYVHPRVEPEVAFLLKRPLAGDVSRDEAMAAIQAVAPAAEIIDSRYRAFKFTHYDVVADNSSSSGYVIGEWQALRDLTDLAVSLEIDGVAVETGSTADILGDPLLSLVEAARLTAASEPLQPGWIVLAGAATAAVALAPGMAVRASVAGLGGIAFTVVE